MKPPNSEARGSPVAPGKTLATQQNRSAQAVLGNSGDTTLPHCSDHPHFLPGCVVCRQARANFEPYPVKKLASSVRSFGYTDDLTEAKLRGAAGPASTWSSANAGADGEFHLSLAVIRFVLRLIWPFSRIL